MAASSRTIALLPAELVVRVFQYCSSFADLRALVLACHHTHAAWVANSPNIIRHVATRDIPAFDQALLTLPECQARATALVHDAFRDGLAPPAISLEEMAADGSRKPSLSELRAVLDLHHLVQTPPPPIGTPEEPERMHLWRERFHAAAYTTFLMGTALARAYNQPFYPDMTQTSSPLDRGAEECRKALFDLMGKASASRLPCLFLGIKEEEREYLRQSPIFDLHDELRAQKETFSPFIKWFIKSTIVKHRARPPYFSRDLSRDEVRAANSDEYLGDGMGYALPTESNMEDWPETGGLSQWFTGSIHMFEFVLTCIANSDGQGRLGRRWEAKAGSFPGKKTRTAKDLCLRSGIPNSLDDRDITPPPPLQLFTFTLRHRYNLQFRLSVFVTYWRDLQDYNLFKSRATIFANDRERVPERDWADYTNGTEFLVEYRSGRLSWLRPEDQDPGVTPRTFLPICYHETADVYINGPRDW
ncbi:hypothetical protein N658DRAFT_482861 [Parathielavia hyrcaniae]|uniref:F-box domain-containing protein n=1 Tax=Parathielavia hyrcaniae TaxID=113614 RepID=A0AAN6QAT1_9PEZI|nr:hypothetical protein N658DRAFT_482861 [Parathielavia hyrcaniae]